MTFNKTMKEGPHVTAYMNSPKTLSFWYVTDLLYIKLQPPNT